MADKLGCVVMVWVLLAEDWLSRAVNLTVAHWVNMWSEAWSFEHCKDASIFRYNWAVPCSQLQWWGYARDICVPSLNVHYNKLIQFLKQTKSVLNGSYHLFTGSCHQYARSSTNHLALKTSCVWKFCWRTDYVHLYTLFGWGAKITSLGRH